MQQELELVIHNQLVETHKALVLEMLNLLVVQLQVQELQTHNQLEEML